MTGKVKVWYTLREYAALTGENLHTVRKQRARGQLPAQRKGQVWVIYLDDLASMQPSLWASLQRKGALEKTGKR